MSLMKKLKSKSTKHLPPNHTASKGGLFLFYRNERLREAPEAEAEKGTRVPLGHASECTDKETEVQVAQGVDSRVPSPPPAQAALMRSEVEGHESEPQLCLPHSEPLSLHLSMRHSVSPAYPRLAPEKPLCSHTL